jgi:beta-glucoside PTS system EIICBA component
MAKVDIKETAKGIVENLGGKDNITSVSHCATRLRIYVKDELKINQKALLKVPGVIAMDKATDQYQVILGQIVTDVCDVVQAMIGIDNEGASPAKKEKKKGGFIALLGRFFEFVAGIMQPIIPALVTAGLLKVLLIILSLCGVSAENSSYKMLSFISDVVFYFLPVFVAYSSAKKFKTDIIISLLLACALLSPGWIAIVQAGNPMSFFGLPVLLTTYSSTFIQIILTIWIMSYVEKWVKKVVPTALSSFFVPLLVTLAMSVIMFVATGPLGGYLSGAIETFVVWIKTTTGGFAPAIITFLGPWIAMGGMHLALIPFAVQQITTVGYDDLINVWFLCFTISAGAVALAVLLKTKNKNLRELAIPAAISGLFGGISEPTVYGISMKMVKPYWANLIAATIAALYAGLVHLKAYAFGAYSLTSLLAYMGTSGDKENFIHACITVAIDIVVTIILVYAFGFDDSIYGDDQANSNPENALDKKLKDGKISIPVTGKFIKQEDLKDNTFRKGLLGPCFGITPDNTDIYSPVDGVVSVLQETKHAIGIVGENGEEILVHIGVDSVELKGEGLENFVKVGDRVTTKTKIASFSREVFTEKKIDDTIIVALTNSDAFKEITFKENPILSVGEVVVEVKA